MPRSPLAALLLGGLALLSPLHAQQPGDKPWPVFRGNALQDGVADSSLPDKLAIHWTFKAKDGVEGAPIIGGQTVYVGSMDGRLYALDLATGKKKWEYQAAPFKASPALRDGAVYIGDVKGVFHCIDAGTGKKRWTFAADAEIVSSANFVEERIVFGSYDHHLYCLSGDGKLRWQCKTKEKVHGAPAVAQGCILVAGCDQALHVIDAAKGREVAAMPLGGQAGASVAVHGDQAYVGTMANQFLALDWKKTSVLWRFDAKTGAQPFYSSPAVTNELVIAGSRDKLVRAWQRQSGKEVWSFATKGRVDSSPVVAGNRVLVGSLDRNLYMLDLARGVELARFELGPISGSPAVSCDRAVIATVLGDVCCLGGKK